MKKFILPVIFLLIIVSGISCFIFLSNDKQVEKETKEKVLEEKINEEDNTVSESTVVSDEVEEPDSDNSSSNEVVSEVKKEDIVSDNTIKESSTKESIKQVEEPKQTTSKTAWEELGMSEEDYYNKPMWSWARIDFSINEYKTENKTKEACESKGNEYFEQGLGYSCTSIYSNAGTYLGEMLKTF